MYKEWFKQFLDANKDKLHFACHSHHYWPDVTFEAQKEYWLDTAKYVDNKWGFFFSNLVPELQELIFSFINVRNKNITFAPNTHELVYRVITSLTAGTKKIKVITTDSEFYSFERQMKRFIECGLCEVKIVSTQPFETFTKRFLDESLNDQYDLAFYSNVFFNSGLALNNLQEFNNEIRAQYKIIDGYHSFMALDLDLSFLDESTFFVAGAYKYAGAGEGSCFLISPKNCDLKPINTGWFAELGELQHIDHTQINFPIDGLRFAGATMDLTPLYRFRSVLNLYKKNKLDVSKIHTHVASLQEYFLEKIKDSHLFNRLINNKKENRGHFLAFNLKSNQKCQEIVALLHKNNVLCDNRNEVIRFGFSIYHSKDDINLFAKLIWEINGEIDG